MTRAHSQRLVTLCRLHEAHNALLATIHDYICPFSLCRCLFGFLPISSADLTVVQSVETSAGTSTITLKIKGERVRIASYPNAA